MAMTPASQPRSRDREPLNVKAPIRRARGTGSVFYSPRRNRWIGQYYGIRSRTHERAAYRQSFLTREDAEDWVADQVHLHARVKRVMPAPMPRLVGRRITMQEAIIGSLRVAKRQGFDVTDTARLIEAWTRPERLRLGVFGQCYYCGDWFANTVDHLMPVSRGGTDEPSNVRSACFSCNSRKGALTEAEWTRHHSDGQWASRQEATLDDSGPFLAHESVLGESG